MGVGKASHLGGQKGDGAPERQLTQDMWRVARVEKDRPGRVGTPGQDHVSHSVQWTECMQASACSRCLFWAHPEPG